MAMIQNLRESYLRKWLATVSPNLVLEFTQHRWGHLGEHMRISCTKCHQMLTGPTPPTAEKIDWATQRFVALHTHDGKIEPVLTIDPVGYTLDKPRLKREGRRFRETN
jgi:hypothetical protein